MSSEFRKEVFFDMETTGLSPFDSQIITIQVRVDGRNIVWPVWEGSEREVVDDLSHSLTGAHKAPKRRSRLRKRRRLFLVPRISLGRLLGRA